MQTLILGGSTYSRPLQKYGTCYYINNNLKNIDCILFTGGADISTYLYNKPANNNLVHDYPRDKEEENIYKKAIAQGIPMIGICRGSQFLNAMNGGDIIQHADNHIRDHTIKDVVENFGEFSVSSTHHQVSVLHKSGLLLAESYCVDEDMQEVEAFWYPDTKCLGVQFHPERADNESTEYKYFTHLIEKYIVNNS